MIDLKNVFEIERNNKIVQKIQTTEKRLPSEYQEVEYIQNTSGQYIDTDINTVEGTFETDVAINENVEKVFIFGSILNNANALSNTVTYKLMWQVGVGGVVQQPMISDTNIHKIRMKTDVTNNYISIELDEEHSDLLSPVINLNNLNIYLFGRNNNGSLQQYGGGEFKCYSFKYWNKNNVLIRNLIPCYRKVDNKSGMYDLVSNTFFPNQGSTEFILGQETDNYKIIYEGYKNLHKSGNLPIVIKNSGNPAINYRIYGNLNRPDTPSKDNPATIYTVGDLITDKSDSNYGKYKIPVIATRGSSVLTTNIYLDEPLRGVSNSSEIKIDYIDFANQKVYRNMEEYVFTGDESWGKVTSSTNPDYFRYVLALGSKIYGGAGIASQLCNCFVWGSPTSTNTQYGISLYVSGTNNYIRFRDSELTTADLIKNFMKEKYNAGEPVRFVYTKNTKSEENVTLPSILLQKGINVISIGTELQPSDFYIKYKGKE